MKLLIHSTAFWPQVGGVETVVMQLAQGLAGLQDWQRVAGDDKSNVTEENIEVTVVTETPSDGLSDAGLSFRVVRQPRLGKLLHLMRQVDLIHIAGPSLLPLTMALWVGKPIALEHHGFQAVCPNGQLFYQPTCTACPGHFMAGRHSECWKCNSALGRWRSLGMWALTFPRRKLCTWASANIAPTHWLAGILRLPRASVIWHGVPGRDIPTELSRGEPPTFVFLGRLVSTKGANLILDAAQRLHQRGLQFRVKLIGDGPERASLEEKSRSSGLGEMIDFPGYMPSAGVETILRTCVAVVMPSIAGEVFGLVAAENMMRGCLMIVPNEGPLAEVAGETALKFKIGDAQDLASTMERVLCSPELTRAWGERAQLRSTENFGVEKMIYAHVELYRALLD